MFSKEIYSINIGLYFIQSRRLNKELVIMIFLGSSARASRFESE